MSRIPVNSAMTQALSVATASWPTMEPSLKSRFSRLLNGDDRQDDRNMIVDRDYFHTQAVAAAGVTNLSFFTSQQLNEHSCNLGVNGVATNEPFALDSIAFEFEDITYTNNVPSGIIANAITDAGAASTLALARMEAKRQIMQNGLVEFKYRNVTIFKIRGLHNFPAGSGMAIDAALATTTANIDRALVSGNNGAAVYSNKRRLSRLPIFPNTQIEVNVRWPFLIPITNGIGLNCRLIGKTLIATQ